MPLLPRTLRSAGAAAAIAVAVALPGCVADLEPPPSPQTSSDAGGAPVELPPTTGTFDYQLGSAGADGEFDVVVRDASAEPAAGAYSVCYVNGFQSQPGDAAFWRAHDDLLLRDVRGPVVDPAWPDEYILDPSTRAQRDRILDRIGPVIDGCARSGFDAVEIDNLDTWTRFDGIEEDGAMALAAAYIDRAHAAGLAVAQKNAAEIAGYGHDELGFDFAVVEECGAWGECGLYAEVYGEHVLQVEYPDALAEAGRTFMGVCASAERAPLTILRDRALVSAGADGHRYASCPSP